MADLTGASRLELLLAELVDELRGIRIALEIGASVAMETAAPPAAAGDEDLADYGPDPAACPSCGQANPEKLEDTSPAPRLKRTTCLSCGASWGPGAEV